MGFILQHKILMGVGVVVIAGGIWFGLSSSSAPQPLLATDAQTTVADQELVATLLELRAVSLNGTIFSDPVFLSLKDFGKEIIPEPVGRPNPFAPLPGVVQPTIESTKSAQIFAPPTTTKKSK